MQLSMRGSPQARGFTLDPPLARGLQQNQCKHFYFYISKNIVYYQALVSYYSTYGD